MTFGADPRDGDAVPGLAPPEPPAGSERIVEVDGEQFLISEYAGSGGYHDYGYTWLTGPDPGYGFGSSGPEMHLTDHERVIRRFLSDIDPDTGHLRESSVRRRPRPTG